MIKKRIGLLAYLLMGILIVLLAVGCGSNKQAANKDTAKKPAYPEKPINFWIPYDAGGGSDIIGRAFAEAAQKHLNQPLVIVNKPGASGLVGMKELYSTKPDGYTVMIQTSTIVTHKLYNSIPYNHRDYTPIITFNYEPACIAVPTSKPWKTVNDFIDHVKKNKAKVATSAKGGIWNIATVAFKKAIGADFDIVASGGGAANSVVMAAGGHVDAVVCSPAEAISQIKSGNLKILAILGPERVSAMPDIPTLKEAAGIDLSVTTTRPLIVPKGTSKEVTDVLYKAFLEASKDPKYLQFLKDNAAMPLSLGPEETIKYFDEQEAFFTKVLKDAGELK